jgi:hypothetical protein
MATSDRPNILKRTFTEFSDDRCPSMAAALAFYTAISLPPLLVLIVTVAGFFWSPDQVQGGLQQQVEGVIGAGGWEQMQTMMERAEDKQQGGWAALISIGVLIFGATGVMVQLQASLNQAWEVEPDPNQGGIKNFLIKRVLSLAMILGVAFLLLVSLVLTAVLNTASGWVNLHAAVRGDDEMAARRQCGVEAGLDRRRRHRPVVPGGKSRTGLVPGDERPKHLRRRLLIRADPVVGVLLGNDLPVWGGVHPGMGTASWQRD